MANARIIGQGVKGIISVGADAYIASAKAALRVFASKTDEMPYVLVGLRELEQFTRSEVERVKTAVLEAQAEHHEAIESQMEMADRLWNAYHPDDAESEDEPQVH
jgi:hypothetical protein